MFLKSLIRAVTAVFVLSVFVTQASGAEAARYMQYDDLEAKSRVIHRIINRYVNDEKLLVIDASSVQQTQEVIGRQNTIIGNFVVENKQNKPITLDSFSVSMSGEYTDAMSSIVITDEYANQIGTTIVSPKRLNIVTDSVHIQAHGSKRFRVAANLNPEKVVDHFSVDFTVSGTTNHGRFGANRVISNTEDGYEVFVRQSKPTFSLQALPSQQLTNGVMTISRFTIHADSNGPVAINQLAWNFEKSTNAQLLLSSPQLYEASDPSTPVAMYSLFVSNITGAIYGMFGSEYIIPPGGSRTFILKTVVHNVNQGDVLTTNLQGPSASVLINGTAQEVRSQDGSFVWSDMSADPHSLTSTDWTNGIDIAGLPSESQVLFN